MTQQLANPFFNSNFISFGWCPRKEGHEECAQRLLKFFRAIVKVDDSFKGISPRYGIPPVKPTLRVARKLFQNTMGEEEWGFDANFGNRDRSLAWSITCGREAEFVFNVCVLSLSASHALFSNVSALMQLAEAIVQCWEPDTGVVTSHACSDKLPDCKPMCHVGWMTYFCGGFGPPPKLSPPSRSVPMGDGNLIVAFDEKLDSNNPEQIALLRKLCKLLKMDQRWDAYATRLGLKWR